MIALDVIIKLTIATTSPTTTAVIAIGIKIPVAISEKYLIVFGNDTDHFKQSSSSGYTCLHGSLIYSLHVALYETRVTYGHLNGADLSGDLMHV